MTSDGGKPLVTAVIPTTLERDRLLRRAVDSVRAQNTGPIEIVVAADVGPAAELPDLGQDVRLLRTPNGPSGPGSARNAGVAAASSPWVAFLDDDDVWVEHKLRRQLAAVSLPHKENLIVSSAFRRLVDGDATVLPRRGPDPGEDLSEWSLCQTFPPGRTGWIAPSTFLVSRGLLRRCPFHDRPNWEDLDWLLRATRRYGAHLVHVDEPLAEVYVDGDRTHRASGNNRWDEIVDWVTRCQDLLTPASAAGLLLRQGASRPHRWSRLPDTLRTVARAGRPRPMDLIALAVGLMVSPHSAARLAALANRW
jgi:glycosyltransferase involved in cell wall biosynthesis